MWTNRCIRANISRIRPVKYCSRNKGHIARLDAIENSHAKLLTLIDKRVREREDSLKAVQTDAESNVSHLRYPKGLKDMERIHSTWRSLQEKRKLIIDTSQLLHDEDPDIRTLAAGEYEQLLNDYNDHLQHQVPALFISQHSQTEDMSVLMEMKPGVGGAESSLFLQELLRMYTRLATMRDWSSKIMSQADKEGGGIKSVILEVNGEGSYDALRWESGVHRVQRIPATESSGRVHTSTVQVVALPVSGDKNSQQDESEKLFDEKDVKIDVMRARGAGGQHVNKTESAVRLTHLPTGITVAMQDERSQHTNKAKAFKILHARLLERKLEADVLERRNARRSLVKSADRSEKIRTYNFAQDRVTDHRVGMTVKGVASVLDGMGLEGILEALSAQHKQKLLEDLLEE